MPDHPVVSHDAWLAARTAFLAKEKAFTKARDELSRERRELPWEKVEKPYVFDGPRGTQTLPELFEGKSQLLVYHFMFDPSWDEGCRGCSFWADNFDHVGVHLAQRDVRFLAVSRAPLAKLEAFKQRMGWSFDWWSSGNSDFNYDFQASFRPGEKMMFNFEWDEMTATDREGASVFYKDAAGDVFHTYSCYARGIDLMNGAYNWLDIVPKGRDEGDRGPYWVRLHDKY